MRKDELNIKHELRKDESMIFLTNTYCYQVQYIFDTTY